MGPENEGIQNEYWETSSDYSFMTHCVNYSQIAFGLWLAGMKSAQPTEQKLLFGGNMKVLFLVAFAILSQSTWASASMYVCNASASIDGKHVGVRDVEVFENGSTVSAKSENGNEGAYIMVFATKPADNTITAAAVFAKDITETPPNDLMGKMPQSAFSILIASGQKNGSVYAMMSGSGQSQTLDCRVKP